MTALLGANERGGPQRTARIVEILGCRPIRYKFIDEGDVIGGPFDLAARTLAMFPFELRTDEDAFFQEAGLEIATKANRNRNSLIPGAS